MIVYHGSTHNFRKLKIDPKLAKRSTLENEGLGIYFSTDIEVAKSYGRYMYELLISEASLLDFRNRDVCVAYVEKIIRDVYDKFKVDIRRMCDVQGIINRINWGGLAIIGVAEEIYMHLDSRDEFYTSISSSTCTKLITYLRSYDKKNRPSVYMFRHSIKNIGVIKDVDENTVQIANKYAWY